MDKKLEPSCPNHQRLHPPIHPRRHQFAIWGKVNIKTLYDKKNEQIK